MRTQMPDHLARFEDRIQRLIEGGLARLFAGELHPREVAARLARAMEDHAYTDADGSLAAPAIYLIRLNPEAHRAILEASPSLADSLAQELVELAQLSGLSLARFPEVRLLADPTIEPHHVHITARAHRDGLDTTEALAMPGAATPEQPTRATLIVNAQQHIALDRPLLNIGRHRDNHLILEDPRVSRHHAQIRLRFGRHVLFDIGSPGRTLVNGRPVREAVLQSGDVITLSGVSLIYVEDAAPAALAGDPDNESTETVSSADAP